MLVVVVEWWKLVVDDSVAPGSLNWAGFLGVGSVVTDHGDAQLAGDHLERGPAGEVRVSCSSDPSAFRRHTRLALKPGWWELELQLELEAQGLETWALCKEMSCGGAWVVAMWTVGSGGVTVVGTSWR